MLPISPINIVFELICFAAFAAICGGLLKPRFSGRITILIAAGCLAIIAGIQVALFLITDGALQRLLTLLPVTAYLPAILTVHVLSKSGFATAVATWSFGLLAPYMLNLLRDLLLMLLAKESSLLSEPLWPVVLCSLVLAGLLVFAAFRFCRKPFRQFEFHNKYVWIIVPVILAFSFVSYVENMNFNLLLAGLLFLSLLVTFLFVAKFLNVAQSEQTARASEREIAAQLELQRQEIARIRQEMEQGRIYRHDMRHHLSVLDGLAEGENAQKIRQYIGDLNERISIVEQEDYCENATVNAVLSAYIGKAKLQNIRVTAKVRIPQQLPMDEIDICTILANALDNAVNACRAGKSERWIELNSVLHDNGNFSIDIRNTCDEPVKFDKDGMPLPRKEEGHGFGLKSIETVVRKYNGLLRCTWNNQVFRFSTVLFYPDNRLAAVRPLNIKKAVSNTTAIILLALCFINAFPETAQALESMPVVGNVLRVVNIRSSFTLGSSSLEATFPKIELEETDAPADSSEYTEPLPEPDSSAVSSELPTSPAGNISGGGESSSATQNPVTTLPPEYSSKPEAKPVEPGTEPSEPKPTEPALPSKPAQPEEEKPVSPPVEPPDISNGIEDMNQQMEEYIQAVEKEFLWYFSQKYHGYVASDTGYNILRNDSRLLSVCFYTTLNVGGSGEYSRCFTLDKATGKVLTLADLFAEGSDYIGVISADILRQMTEQVEARETILFPAVSGRRRNALRQLRRIRISISTRTISWLFFLMSTRWLLAVWERRGSSWKPMCCTMFCILHPFCFRAKRRRTDAARGYLRRSPGGY